MKIVCVGYRSWALSIYKELKKNNIAIMGHMGSGKSSIGRMLAKELGLKHIDSDREIVKYTNKSINQIFNITYGQSKKINNLLSCLEDNFKNLNVSHIDRDKLMPLRGTLSTNKAKKLIGYNPKWPLIKGYQKYINWYKNLFFKKF